VSRRYAGHLLRFRSNSNANQGEGIMRRLILTIVLGTFQMTAGVTALDSVTAGPSAAGTRANVEQRVLIKHCYGQYRSQSDITRCLGQGAI
jgi:hypothetical protein